VEHFFRQLSKKSRLKDGSEWERKGTGSASREKIARGESLLSKVPLTIKGPGPSKLSKNERLSPFGTGKEEKAIDKKGRALMSVKTNKSTENACPSLFTVPEKGPAYTS